MAVTKFGGYTEALIVPQEHVFQLPRGMTLQEAAALPAVYITAYHSLVEVMRVRRGDDILIQAVAGGVGIAALQIAKHYGLTVYGTASSDAKLIMLKSSASTTASITNARILKLRFSGLPAAKE